jgi:hypothetical protein
MATASSTVIGPCEMRSAMLGWFNEASTVASRAKRARRSGLPTAAPAAL